MYIWEVYILFVHLGSVYTEAVGTLGPVCTLEAVCTLGQCVQLDSVSFGEFYTRGMIYTRA